jgi:hypothetical protein
MDHTLEFVKIVVFDWYDGPVGGVVALDGERWFSFFLLDWDLEHRVRIFALKPISYSIDHMIKKFSVENPTWPVWFPSELVHPDDQNQDWASLIKAINHNPENTDRILVWDTTDQRCLGVRNLPHELGSHAVSWFDAIESSEGPWDWFDLLSVTRT